MQKNLRRLYIVPTSDPHPARSSSTSQPFPQTACSSVLPRQSTISPSRPPRPLSDPHPAKSSSSTSLPSPSPAKTTSPSDPPRPLKATPSSSSTYPAVPLLRLFSLLHPPRDVHHLPRHRRGHPAHWECTRHAGDDAARGNGRWGRRAAQAGGGAETRGSDEDGGNCCRREEYNYPARYLYSFSDIPFRTSSPSMLASLLRSQLRPLPRMLSSWIHPPPISSRSPPPSPPALSPYPMCPVSPMSRPMTPAHSFISQGGTLVRSRTSGRSPRSTSGAPRSSYRRMWNSMQRRRSQRQRTSTAPGHLPSAITPPPPQAPAPLPIVAEIGPICIAALDLAGAPKNDAHDLSVSPRTRTSTVPGHLLWAPACVPAAPVVARAFAPPPMAYTRPSPCLIYETPRLEVIDETSGTVPPPPPAPAPWRPFTIIHQTAPAPVIRALAARW
ncbi:hypothetical protein C8R43DRAFT_22643 [Mycena crocata]|nr:hypothetical protein C8R43DRAFT_22643 [Mycena crocata]